MLQIKPDSAGAQEHSSYQQLARTSTTTSSFKYQFLGARQQMHKGRSTHKPMGKHNILQ